MLADGLNLTTIELDEGEKIPNDLTKYDGMLCMGGPMDTYMEKEYPWLVEEKKRIKEFVVNLKKPYLGFCLGCQLLGEVVGGKVVKSNPAEIGMMDINFTDNKKKDILFSKFPDNIKSLQWHSYEVQGVDKNPDITLIASSPITKYQIFKYQGRPIKDPARSAWRKARRDCGLSDFRFHDLRHTWASRAAKKGLTEAQIAHLGGWNSTRMVSHYTDLNDLKISDLPGY